MTKMERRAAASAIRNVVFMFSPTGVEKYDRSAGGKKKDDQGV